MSVLFTLAVALVPLAVLFRALERRPARTWRDRSTRTDIAYWFASPLVAKIFGNAAFALTLIAADAAVGRHAALSDLEQLLAARGPVGRQPVWLQTTEAVILADLLGYWMHRVFHSTVLWHFHAIHHGSEQLDWLSAVRNHPIDEVLLRIGELLPLTLLGFDPRVFFTTVPLFALHMLVLHANVPWDFGPLRCVITSPLFHRWHHAADANAVDKNFAGVFALWDLLFGTYYLPAHAPARVGLVRGQCSPGMARQMTEPFRVIWARRRTAALPQRRRQLTPDVTHKRDSRRRTRRIRPPRDFAVHRPLDGVVLRRGDDLSESV